MSTARPWLLALLLLASGCDEDAATPSATPVVPAAVPDAGVGAELARLEGLTGDVRLERGGKSVPAVAGPLHGGDAVETGAGGAATVRFPDGRSVEVGEDARFALGEDSGGIVMQVERGIVLSRVPAGTKPAGPGTKKVTLSILTPFGLTRVGSDAPSEVSVAVEKDAGRVEVRLGAIEFVGKDGQQLRAAQGESVSVAQGKAELVRTPRVVELAPIPVTVRLGAGRAEVRPKGTVHWRPVAKQGEVLSPGDGVRTRQGGTAVLALQGSSSVLSLGSATELVLESAGQGGTTDEARVDLRQGGLGLQLAQGRTSRVVLPGLDVEGHGAAGLEVRRTSTGYRVDAFTGQVTLVRGESRQPLRAGERATLEGDSGTARVEPLQPAAVALGASEGAEVHHQGLPEVAFTWEGEGAMRVEVATDAGFTRPVLAGTVYRPFVNVPALARGTLYWRVRREDGTELAKGSASFAPERPSKDLDRVRNVVPEGPEKTTIFYQDKPPAVTFTYGEEASAAKYRVAVYRMGALGTPVAERTVADTRAALDAGALSEGSYLWSVTPLSASGAQLRGGRMNKLELVYDNSVPELVVTSPRNGTRAAEKVRAMGVAPVDARLSINGRPVPLDGKHRFSTWVEPVGSPPLLVFKMERPGAPEVHTVRTLKQRGP
ncbi:FecR domain-containing protein [Pyxidicoccus parkwayensis]|uniref:FecR domain-containing protein n=1 Tax=Pyxidicoccus parkwayensis TaxID=2813578 RepID=A0ABX7NKN9_9BACT|nr:FecR domain-containing protein [Pyxidicoccus parkwaysis]QSQ19406.1 FecR domain-containing protein [Pyxidicoccus parkwaysis]